MWILSETDKKVLQEKGGLWIFTSKQQRGNAKAVKLAGDIKHNSKGFHPTYGEHLGE